MTRIVSIFGVILALAMLSSCGPSAEQVATMTALAWTPTPPPTPTSTPIPYGLSVSVADEAGAPIPGATIVFPESGDDQPVQADAQGTYTWNNLPNPAGSLSISGQGYFPAQQAAALERGPNEIKITLKRDPFGLLPADTCAPGQKVLYVEDFQDGRAQDWPTIAAGVNGDMPNGWILIEENGNKILQHADAPSPSGDELQNITFDNFVWHAKFKVIGNDADMFFMWRVSHADDGSRKRYAAVVTAKGKPWMVRFVDQQTGPLVMNTASAIGSVKQDQWHDLAIAYFNGNHQVWYDGKKQMEYKDPTPFPAGTIGFETHLDSNKTTRFFIDDMVMCELTAAYQPAQ